ncbi:polysulfide reductase NrfD [Halalkaliarchaeum desulfuricum]|uniref:Polysulfide reductase NrfD n=1 Tax=Halalkaliarchaeum desulfuricum TaxID=2055893 RepID=A0A343TMQ0_9EURY|nr:NrfD/PsrC family molybdoenzyme membrane anchor subunit [Halalkaliarchaeum desulfuricum]AUX10372.1 polysulfide reductase NrfD [Halalkaliarchaeum desulfuricum]
MFESPGELWGTLIGTYLFLGGLAGGAYVTGAVADYLSYRNEQRSDAYRMTARWGMVISVLGIAVGGLGLLFHLGEPTNVAYFWLFTQMNSWMTIGVWIIAVFVLLAVIQALWLGFGKGTGFGLPFRRINRLADFTRPTTKERLALNAIGAIVGIVLIVYTALLISDVYPVVPLWHPVLLPLLFLASGLSMGICATIAVTAIKKGVHGTGVHEFSLADDVVILSEIAILAVFLYVLQAQGAIGVATFERLTETFAFEFWIGVVVIGLILPLVISGAVILANRMDGFSIGGTTEKAAYVTKFGFVIIGGWFLRMAVLFSAINVPII